jgi:hypothetical protein
MPEPEDPEPVSYAKVDQRPKVKRITIDKEIVKKLRHLKNARALAPAQVRSFLETLRAGGFFESVMIVNTTTENGKERWWLIDGGHRLRAIEMRLEEAPDAKIVVDFHIYKDLTKEQELVVFEHANGGRRVKAEQRLKIWSPFIPVLKMMDAALPCKLSFDSLGPGERAIRYTTVLRAYMGRYNLGHFHSQDLVAPARRLGEDDALAMGEFMRFMIAVAGEPVRESVYFKSVAFAVFAKVYFCNLNPFRQEDLVARFKAKVITDTMTRDNLATHAHAASMCEQLTDMVVAAANKGFDLPKKRLITVARYKEEAGQ